MSINPDIVEDIITEAQEEYLDKTIIIEDFLREPKTYTDHECRQEYGVESTDFDTANHSHRINSAVSGVVKCEKMNFIKYLEDASNENHQIGHSQFYMDLLGAAVDALSPKHIYLPDKHGYKNELKAHDSSDGFNQPPKLPVHWFNPDIFPNKGFLVEQGVYVEQLRQGDYDPMPGNVDSTVDIDYSDNRLHINLRKKGVVTVFLRSKFTVDLMDSDDPLIHTLDLPAPSKI